MDAQDGLLGLEGVGRRGQRPWHAEDLGTTRGDAHDPDPTAVVPRQCGDEIEGAIGRR